VEVMVCYKRIHAIAVIQLMKHSFPALRYYLFETKQSVGIVLIKRKSPLRPSLISTNEEELLDDIKLKIGKRALCWPIHFFYDFYASFTSLNATFDLYTMQSNASFNWGCM